MTDSRDALLRGFSARMDLVGLVLTLVGLVAAWVSFSFMRWYSLGGPPVIYEGSYSERGRNFLLAEGIESPNLTSHSVLAWAALLVLTVSSCLALALSRRSIRKSLSVASSLVAGILIVGMILRVTIRELALPEPLLYVAGLKVVLEAGFFVGIVGLLLAAVGPHLAAREEGPTP